MRTTAPYRCPPPHQFPPAHECTVEDLLDIAARTLHGALHELMSSSPHVEALCQLVQQLDCDLRTADEQRTAALADANDLRAKHAAISNENAVLRIQAGINALALIVTGKTAAELSHEHAIEAHAEREHRRATAVQSTRLERSRADTVQIAQVSEITAAYRSQSMLFDISDTDVIDEPTVGRAQTRRIPEAVDGFEAIA